MAKVTIDRVFTKEQETKFGTKLSVGIKVKEDKVADIDGAEWTVTDKYINGLFPVDFQFPYAEGDEAIIQLIENNGYFNFKLPKSAMSASSQPRTGGNSELIKRLESIEARLTKLEGTDSPTVESPQPVAEEMPDPEDF